MLRMKEIEGRREEESDGVTRGKRKRKETASYGRERRGKREGKQGKRLIKQLKKNETGKIR